MMFAAHVTPHIGQKALLIEKKTYPLMTTTGVFDFAMGGSVAFTGHPVYENNAIWGPHLVFDNARTTFDWCNFNGTSPLFGQWVFPRRVTMKSIFLIPRLSGDGMPTSLSVEVDGVSIGSFTATTLDAGSGHYITYAGPGYHIQPNFTGTTWRLNFGGSIAYIGEIEFWGY